MTQNAILDGHEPKMVDVRTWAEWFETADRRVGRDDIGGATVSTVFLGLDYSFGLGGPPLWFETLVFGGEHDVFQARYTTWDEAEAGHAAVVAALREGRAP